MNQLIHDPELMALAASSNPVAQRMVVQRLIGRVERLARSLLANAADASDASQASLLEILRSAGRFRGESTLERWADRIVVRTSLRYISQERAHGARATANHEPAVGAAGDPTVIAHEFLDRLPPLARTVIILRHGFEYSIDEIAELTGVSPNTAKDRLLRAREAIRCFARREQFLAGGGGARRCEST